MESCIKAEAKADEEAGAKEDEAAAAAAPKKKEWDEAALTKPPSAPVPLMCVNDDEGEPIAVDVNGETCERQSSHRALSTVVPCRNDRPLHVLPQIRWLSAIEQDARAARAHRGGAARG